MLLEVYTNFPKQCQQRQRLKQCITPVIPAYGRNVRTTLFTGNRLLHDKISLFSKKGHKSQTEIVFFYDITKHFEGLILLIKETSWQKYPDVFLLSFRGVSTERNDLTL